MSTPLPKMDSTPRRSEATYQSEIEQWPKWLQCQLRLFDEQRSGDVRPSSEPEGRGGQESPEAAASLK